MTTAAIRTLPLIRALAAADLRPMTREEYREYADAEPGTLIGEGEALGRRWTFLVPPEGSEELDDWDVYAHSHPVEGSDQPSHGLELWVTLTADVQAF